MLTVPCDAKCVFAIGKTCDCSCGGKNHGSGLLAPVIRGVVDFSGVRVPGYQQTAADYRAYLARLQSLRDSPPAAVAAALIESGTFAAEGTKVATILLTIVKP